MSEEGKDSYTRPKVSYLEERGHLRAVFTKEHAEIFQHHAKTWQKVAYSTEPIDKPKATAAIKALHKMEGLDEPVIVWTQSPLANIFIRDFIMAEPFNTELCRHFWVLDDVGLLKRAKRIVEDVLKTNSAGLRQLQTEYGAWCDFDNSIGFAYDDRVKASITESLRNPDILSPSHITDNHERNLVISKKLWASFNETFERNLDLSVKDITDKAYVRVLKDKLAEYIKANRSANNIIDYNKYTSYPEGSGQLPEVIDNIPYTQYDVAKLTQYMFLYDAGLISKIDSLHELYALCSSAGTILAGDRICFVSERPKLLKLDNRGLPHCEDGPAILYSDGFCIYAWHGVRFPHDWIETPPSPTEALQWPNLEQRRVACELVGWGAIIETLDGQTIDKDNDPEIGELISVCFPEGEVENFLRVTCGTGREFVMPVPSEMETALQANAWTWGLEPDQYKPEVRT